MARLKLKRKLHFSYFQLGLFVFLSITTIVIVSVTSTKNFLFHFLPKAGFGNSRSELASGELGLIKPIYDDYIGNVADLNGVYGPVLTQPGISSSRDLIRTLSSELILEAVIGKELAPNNRMVDHFIKYFSTVNFINSYQAITAGTVGQGVLTGINLTQKAIPATKLAEYLVGIRSFANNLMNDRTANGSQEITKYYQVKAQADLGDTSGEESNSVATFFILWSKVAPTLGPGSITEAERSKFFQEGIKLLAYTFSQCDRGCPFRSGSWLAANHGRNPSLHYTLSILYAAGDIQMVYNQLGIPLPSSILALMPAITSISKAVDTYLKSDFSYTGPFSFINPDGSSYDTFSYDKQKLTFKDGTALPITSSVPVNNIDAINFFMPYNSTALKAYILQADTMWHFTCELTTTPNKCKAIYQNNTTNQWGTLADPNGYWKNYPLPTKFDAHTSWYPVGSSTLFSTLWAGNRIWTYTCGSTGCNHQQTKSLADLYTTINQTGWLGVNPPTDTVDTVSQFVVNASSTLKSYIFKGNRVWAYNCSLSATGIASNCQALYTKDLRSYWQQIPNNWDTAGWTAHPPPEQDIDATTQYFMPNGSQRTHIIKGNRIWTYDCPNCRAVSTMELKQYLENISRQFVWDNPVGSGQIQFTGVSDWGFDATAFNNAFVGAGLFNPTLFGRFQQLLDAEYAAQLSTHPRYPTAITSGKWSFQPVSYISALSAGLKMESDGVSVGSEYRPMSNDELINSNWWANMFTGLNHAYAYLAISEPGKLHQFASTNEESK
jgi:hypothetical protein